VTELVAGLDIVVEQFRLAAGEGLSPDALAAAGRAASPHGHAIEVRLVAEDPARNFAPVPGRITRWSMPSGPGIRVDTATSAGDVVPPDYDPLIAKLIVHAGSREAARRRLVRALDEMEIGGIQTTAPFFRFVATHPAFDAPDLSTDWVADHWDGGRSRAAALDAATLAAAAAQLHDPASSVATPSDGARGGASPVSSGGTPTGSQSEATAARRRWRDIGRDGEGWGR
jgi:acetyl/propionyl-CoA carboxylase alpha subunit